MARVAVATWNLENFASTADNFAEKLKFVARTLESVDADIVALQEVLDEPAAKQLAHALEYELTLGQPDGRGIRVAFLSRWPPLDVEVLSAWRLRPGVNIQEMADDGKVVRSRRMPRAALRIRVRYARSRELDLVNVHFKSKLLSFPGGRLSTEDESERALVAHLALQRRAAEAATVRQCATELLDAGRHVIVLGDLNDGPQAATTEVLYGPPGSQARGAKDAASKNSGFNRKDSGDGQRLFNVTLVVDEERRWSRAYAGQYELIDHVLAGVSLMMPRREQRLVAPKVGILNDKAPIRGEDPVTDGVRPDHACVFARFE